VGQMRAEYRCTGTGFWAMKAALLAVVILTVASIAFHFAAPGSGVASASAGSSHLRASKLGSGDLGSSDLDPRGFGLSPVANPGARPTAHPVSASSLSFPLFFEPNVGQTDSRVKFLARGVGYGLFLTADEAVLSLQHHVAKGEPTKSTVVRMHLEGASSRACVQGAELLPGKSNYFIGNDPRKWHSGVSQFARVEYQHVYPGVDLVYYGNQRQLEYDFRVAPGADPNQIAMSFKGASAHVDAGDVVLSTADGDLRFRAPRIYQPASQNEGAAHSSNDTTVAGGFRVLAGNKIGFTVGTYDHSRELVIDPQINYFTYLGMGGESLVNVAIDSSDNIYVAGSTTSATFPVTTTAIQPTLGGPGAQNIFVAVLNPLAGSGAAQLLFATYLGGSGLDQLGGVAVDPGNSSFPNINVYVAGTTTSPDFPTTSTNAFQSTATFTGTQTHGFVSAINASSVSGSNVYTLAYSTYLAGNSGTAINGNNTTENDVVTGLAVDSFFDAYVTGTTTSSDILTGFPSTPNGYQICPWQPAQSGGTPCPVTVGPTQFFASEINTAGSGPQSMLYSTYFGGGYPSIAGGYPANAIATGGGVAVDLPSNNPRNSVNMYFTGTTNMPGVPGPNGEAPFPLINAWQSCLNQSGQTQAAGCGAAGTNTDAFLVKVNPNQVGATPSFSTYLGGAQNDTGIAVAVDNSGDTYITGSTNSSDWNCVTVNACHFPPAPYNALNGAAGGPSDAFIAQVTNFQGGIFPLVFFAYIGGSGVDNGNAIAVDSVQGVHIAGTTASNDLPLLNATQPSYGGGVSDAFVALLSATLVSGNTGNYVTYLGGNSLDQGTGIAIDNTGTTYVAGATQSSSGFTPVNPYQSGLIGTQDAFVAELGSNSALVLSIAPNSPSPSPLPAGTQGSFIYNITNNGPDPASDVTFSVGVPQSGLQNLPTAEVISNGAGSCTAASGGTISCQVGSLAAGAVAQVAIFVTPSIPQVEPTVGVTSAQAFANGGQASNKLSQSVPVTDFSVTAVVTNNGGAQIVAGQLATIAVTLTPDQTLGYNASVTLTQSSSPSMVTSPAPTFTINPVVLTGTAQQTTILDMQTVPRPVNSGSLFRHRAFYAAWLPIGGLSLMGLGIGASRKRRRWLIGMLLGLVAGLILLQPACSSGSTAAQSGGGTQAGLYFITITASAGTGASHQYIVSLTII
jgi:hypothetical protein